MTDEPHPAPRRALITGASLGIGEAFARRLAADGWDLILVARDAGRLDALAAELTERHDRRVETISADLSNDDGCALVERRLVAEPPVGLLVNNAGISLNTPFVRSAVEDEARLLRLNVLAVLRLTHAALPPMIERGAGAVINVSSVAGFGVPMPGSTYSASKAWVTNFSESIGQSVAPLGVRVMALCPGYTRTGYHERAGIDMSRTPGWMWLRPAEVVDEGLRDLGKGKLVSVPSWKYKLAVAGLRHAPRRLLRGVSRDTRGRVGRGRD
ncbi:SDR family oxidoreductase [Micromonospora sp. DR5-3]|uniref:SDR family NAD(P)-dependent oxidoreductase n=1 Tax=unclassified Micromonospora TaxID=2617518 RepID=UPI0011D77794|nr:MULTISPECIES: SDR family oxidoreductase [unclassified Micromonospora]MCW3813671.1 SDR family oxidoreductase [Micromonospora sp. DR5-3]TYC25631.1 SDR family oxidoreductase [Micromonospora sp. MP36]